MDYRFVIFLVSASVFVACAIAYNFIIHRKNKRIAELEDENCGLRAETESLRKDRDDLYERYMASLEREARRDG